MLLRAAGCLHVNGQHLHALPGARKHPGGVTDPKAYFRCERLAAVVMVETCAKRRKLAIETRQSDYTSGILMAIGGHGGRHKHEVSVACRSCAVGDNHLVVLRMKVKRA